MIDIKWIRENKEQFDKLMSLRGFDAISDQITILDEEKRQLTTLIQQLQHARKEKAKSLSYIKDKNSKEFEDAKRDAAHINDKLEELVAKSTNNDKLNKILETIPNLPLDDVPFGKDESMNKVLRSWGEPKKIDNAAQHFEIGEKLKMMDFAQTANISGSRFVTLFKDLARLERALANFMLDTHIEESGFTEVSPPYLVRDEAMYNAGQLPKFSDESYLTTDEKRLIPTSEVSLVNMVANKIIDNSDFPIRFVAHTPCFRSEAGSAGKDTRGMVRLHQFNKVELVTIAKPEDSEKEHELILKAAESILQKLKLPYQVVLLCTGDMGFHAAKTIDLEVWLPGQNKYREIASISNCTDFQARRMKTRYKNSDGKNSFVHTLNGSGLATGRTLLAILENYQNSDGSVDIPEILQPYMNGQTKISI